MKKYHLSPAIVSVNNVAFVLLMLILFTSCTPLGGPGIDTLPVSKKHSSGSDKSRKAPGSDSEVEPQESQGEVGEEKRQR